MAPGLYLSWRYRAIACWISASCVLASAAPCRAQEPTNHGAYLAYVTGCVGCHSPHDEAGNVLEGRLLAGGDHPIRASGGAGVYPPNITPDTTAGIGGWTESQMVAVLAHGEVPGGRVLSSAMPWRTQYDKLSQADMEAIARYILSVPAVAGRPAAHG